MSLYKKISIFGLFLAMPLQGLLAQNKAQPLAEVSNPEYYAAPALTGDPAKDAEIRTMQQRDLAKYGAYRVKMYETLGGRFNAAQTEYAKTVGMPDFNYTGIAENDWQRYKNAFKVWAKANEAALPAIQQHLLDLSKQ